MLAVTDTIWVALIVAIGGIGGPVVLGHFTSKARRLERLEDFARQDAAAAAAEAAATKKADAAATKLDVIHNTVIDVKKDTHAIDSAVNNAELGMPTVAQRMIDSDKREIEKAQALAAQRAWEVGVLKLITDKLEIPVPPPPAAAAPVVIALPSGADEITKPRLTNAEAVADQEPPSESAAT